MYHEIECGIQNAIVLGGVHWGGAELTGIGRVGVKVDSTGVWNN